jgi:ubiquitin carboxyl-terminal hydrolase L5
MNYDLRISYIQTDHTKRTFDYEPFIREYIQSLQQAGLLNPLLDRDSDGKKKRVRKPAAAPKS